MNGLGNCLYEICCPPRSEGAVKALAEEMAGALSRPEGDTYEDIARWTLDTFDLAPKGSLQAFKDAVRDYAREGYVKADSTKLRADHAKEI
jgi:hypothetical protein